MNVEKTIEFMLEEQARFQARSGANQACFDANFARAAQRSAKAEKRMDRIERVFTQTNRVVGKLASISVTLRSDIRRHERAIARHEDMMAEMDGKLKALVAAGEKTDSRTAFPWVDRALEYSSTPWLTSLTRWPAEMAASGAALSLAIHQGELASANWA